MLSITRPTGSLVPSLLLLHSRTLSTSIRRATASTDLFSSTKRHEFWGGRGFGRPPYPRTANPPRIPGADLNLQERLDLMYEEQNQRRMNRVDVGFPAKQENRRKRAGINKKKKDPELERASRLRTLHVNVDNVKQERIEMGTIFSDIRQAADLYGVYEDLFDSDTFFTPNTYLKIDYDFDEEYVTPVHRGNIIKPREARKTPDVRFKADSPDSLYTLILTNPDTHFTEENKEYLHWMVGNIKGDDLSSGTVPCPYLQPFPPKGTGYHRFCFILYKQNEEIDLSSEIRSDPNDLKARTFSNWDFFQKHKNQITPCGLAFFQSDWDENLREFFHNTLNMKEPRYEYHFTRPHYKAWNRLNMQTFRIGFNLYLDKFRDPKEIQEELVKKKLKIHHPFEGNLQKHIKFINAHNIDDTLPQWRRREIERERLRQGYYTHLDWKELRRDPTWA